MRLIVRAWILVLALLVCGALSKYPDKTPLIDRCTGKAKKSCTKNFKKECVWDETGAPDCFERSYFKQVPARRDPLDIVIRFFEFSFGVHLTEGNSQETHSVASVADCARLCLNSAGRTGIPCLSFDFYPIEDFVVAAPHSESGRSGYCILNTSNKDTARLRNSDMGYTDAELFYESHYTNRPFSGEEGYYELRDPRGGQISNMLEYNRGVDFTAQNIWPRSRWGLMFLSTPIRVSAGYICSEPDTDPDNSPIIDPSTGNSVEFSQDASVRFTGAFTPVDWDQVRHRTRALV
jgi:hypothetical protein